MYISMFEFLVGSLLVGAAVVWLTELISSLLYKWVSKKLINRVLVLPLSYIGIWALFGKHLYLPNSGEFVVLVPASAFVALVVIRWLDKPVIIDKRGRF